MQSSEKGISQPAASEEYIGAFPCSSAHLTEVSSTSSHKNVNYRNKDVGFGEADCLHNQQPRGKPILGLNDSGKSFSALQVGSRVSAMKQRN